MEQKRNRYPILDVIFFLFFLYLFFVSIEMMSEAFKLFGKGFANSLMSSTSRPIVGLFIGMMATGLVQSSSSVTSILVGLVAGGALSISHAIPIVMGANIGTTITNAIVSMGHIGRRQEFSRALSGAIVHDFFNVLCVIIFLPLEVLTHFIEKTAVALAGMFEHVGGFTFMSPLKAIVQPVAKQLCILLNKIVLSPSWAGAIFLLFMALLLLFLALRFMVTLMRKLIIGKVENLLHRYLFSSPLPSLLLGLSITAIIQSSSATTSLIVPIVGAGILTVEQIFPYVLGTNIGTTVTAILASLVTKSPAALTVAFAHLTFNVAGTVLIFPFRIVPISLAKKFGVFMAQHRVMAPIFIIFLFFVIPLLAIFLIQGGF